MRRKLARFLALSAVEKAVLVRAMWWLPVTVLALKLGGLRQSSRAAAAKGRAPGLAPGRIAQLVALASRHGLARGNCLSQSLTLQRLLGGAGATQLRIGARQGPAGLEAHAWIEHEGLPLNDTADVAERYAPFPALPSALPHLA
jgi:hypothetical protein